MMRFGLRITPQATTRGPLPKPAAQLRPGKVEQVSLPEPLSSKSRISVLSAAHSYVDVKRLTAWLPTRDLHIDKSNAMIGDGMRIAASNRYDIREVVFKTDGLIKFLSHSPGARQALRDAVLRRGSVQKFVEKLSPPSATPRGSSQVDLKASSLNSMSISDSRVVLGNGSRVKVNNLISLRRIKVDLVDGLRLNWIDPQAFVDTLRDQTRTDRTRNDRAAKLIRDSGREVARADIATLAQHSEGRVSTPKTRVTGVLGSKVVTGASVTTVGIDNKTISEVSIKSGRAVDDVSTGLPRVLDSIGIAHGSPADHEIGQRPTPKYRGPDL